MKSHCLHQNQNRQSMQVWLTLHVARLWSIWAIPYASRPPKVFAIPFPTNQRPCLQACSDCLYQIPVRRLKPGETVDSVTPSKTRRATSPAKFWAAPWHPKTTAHTRLFSIRKWRTRGIRKISDWHRCRQKLCKWKFDKSQWSGVVCNQIAKVKGATKPAILLAN